MSREFMHFTAQDRAINDFYTTDPFTINRLIYAMEKYGEYDISHDVWECATGNNDLADRLSFYGHNVRRSDIVVRKPNVEEIDFLNYNEKWNGDILTNPPFNLSQEFISHALSLINTGNKVIMLLRLSFLESQKRKQFFENTPLKYVYVASERVQCYKNGDTTIKGTSAVAYAWYVWEKGFEGEPIIRWC